MARLAAALLACVAVAAASRPARNPRNRPMFATTKVDGTDGV